MPRELRNIGASVRARLLDRARAERSDFQILLTRYALERLLYRLSVSPHRDRFILKGAMLFVTWVADPFRPTRDLDLLGHGDNDAESIAETFRAICAQPVADDGVTFDVAALMAAPIREEVEYGGVRVRTTAIIAGGAHSDPGRHWLRRCGDASAHRNRLSRFARRSRAASSSLPCGNGRGREIRGIGYARHCQQPAQDFYDLWLIAKTFDLDRSVLTTAVQNTFGRRQTALPGETPLGLSDAYAETWDNQWRAFLGRERMAAAPQALATVVADLRGFLLPLAETIEGDWQWAPKVGWFRPP